MAGETTSAAAGERHVGALTATAVVVASMVGTGVFTTTGLLLRDLGSPGAVLLAWLVGGVLALCGALSYAELGAALPRNGGEYQLLSRIYHPAVGFAAGLVSLVVGFSAPLAASALAFGHYLSAVVPGTSPTVAATALVAAAAVPHATHARLGGRVQVAVTALELALVAAFVAAGLARGDPTRLAPAGGAPLAAAVTPAFAVALVYVSFAYSGWNAAVYLAGEVREPSRTVPRALLVGTAAVMALYLALNVVFLAAAPPGDLAGVVQVGHVAAARLLGARAGTALSALVALALAASVSAMLMAGPRVYEQMGRDHPRLALLARRTRRGGPVVAVTFQAATALAMIATSTFAALLLYVGFTLSLVAGLTVLGVLVLRRREPGLARPIRTWGYPATPLLFLALSAWMIVHALVENPAASWAGVATALGGVGLHALLGRRGGTAGAPTA
ncbi:MAG TPA: amino acid permease [Anaeromyxobacter sp.]|nr:amino acid permease [Anaeromyxobacter sp.]